jgi:tellurite resistance protein
LLDHTNYDDDFKENLILMGLFIAMIDGKVVPEESTLIKQAGQILELSAMKLEELNRTALSIHTY